MGQSPSRDSQVLRRYKRCNKMITIKEFCQNANFVLLYLHNFFCAICETLLNTHFIKRIIVFSLLYVYINDNTKPSRKKQGYFVQNNEDKRKLLLMLFLIVSTGGICDHD